MRRRLSVLTAALVVLPMTVALPWASAASPGKNGTILFQGQASHQQLLTEISPSGGGETVLARDEAGDADPSWNPYGTRIAFERSAEIWVQAADGTGQVDLTPGFGNSGDPTWSPDGSKLAFTHFDNGDTEIWTVDVKTKKRVRLTHDDSTDLQPAWSSRNQIAYRSYQVDETTQLFVINADGTGEKDLTNDTTVTDSDPDWSPDGSTLVFTRSVDEHCDKESFGADLWTMSATGTGVTSVCHHVSTGSDGAEAVFSPDGHALVYTANNGTGGLQLWLSPFPATGADTQLTTDAGNPTDQEATWQPVVPAATAAVSPKTVVRGRSVTVTGTRFAPGEQVTITVTDHKGKTVTLTAATASSTGAVSAARVLPKTLAAGAATITLRGATSFLSARVPLTLK